MNVLFGMIDMDVLHDTTVIFNYLSQSQAKPDILLYISSLRLKRCLNHIVIYCVLIFTVIDPEPLFYLNIFDLSHLKLNP